MNNKKGIHLMKFNRYCIPGLVIFLYASCLLFPERSYALFTGFDDGIPTVAKDTEDTGDHYSEYAPPGYKIKNESEKQDFIKGKNASV